MVDLSRNLTLAKQAIDKRNYDYAIEVCEQCQELDPRNLEVYKLMIDAAKRRMKEKGKPSMFATMRMPGMSNDPQKKLTILVKGMAKSPELKNFGAVGDAAYELVKAGQKAMGEVAILFYEEARATGLFNAEVLFSLGNLHFERFKETKSPESLEKALKCMAELARAKPDHPIASKLLRDWEAAKSMTKREDRQVAGGDFRNQVNSTDAARKQEVMNRIHRTWEEAKEAVAFIDVDLQATPTDKSLWLKRGDLQRRFTHFADARGSYTKAQEVDPHDFTITIRLGDTRIDEAKSAVTKFEQGGQDPAPAKTVLLQIQIEEFKRRVERQPTESEHRFNLGLCLIQAGQVEAAAAEFQRTVQDPKRKRDSHRYLGFCFSKKGLVDLAVQQYTNYLSLADDPHADQAKEVLYTRARLYEQSKRLEAAITDYTRLVEIDLGYRDVATRLAALQGGG